MTDTETPIEAGARALHDRTYAGLDVGLWDRRTEVGRKRFLGDARAVFASVGVEGLARAMRDADCTGNHHGTSACPDRHCRDDRALAAYMKWAEAVAAWLTGGGA